MLMWLLSDRALPHAYCMIQGFGVHTSRFINDDGESRFVKLYWLPKLGTYSCETRRRSCVVSGRHSPEASSHTGRDSSKQKDC